MRILSTVILLFIFKNAWASDSTIMTKLLLRISELQTKNSAVFPKGSIPSYRLYGLNKTLYKADVNPFYTALTTFTLEDIKPELSVSQQKIANEIISNSLPVYSKFRNKKGRDTYNFWPTDTPQFFPNGGVLNLLKKSKALPDDMDDTVIILLAQKSKDSINQLVHDLMQGFINTEQKKVIGAFKEFENVGAYSTWFGIKMHIDFDVCVLSNILYFVQYNHLKWTAADSASLKIIENIISTHKLENYAKIIAPHYATTAVILYHISRLMALKPIPSLEKYKSELISLTERELISSKNFMEKVVLSTALLRWGVMPPPIQYTLKDQSIVDLVSLEEFYFFKAGITTIFPIQLKKALGEFKPGSFYYFSPAYNNLLLLENLAWNKRIKNRLGISTSAQSSN